MRNVQVLRLWEILVADFLSEHVQSGPELFQRGRDDPVSLWRYEKP